MSLTVYYRNKRSFKSTKLSDILLVINLVFSEICRA